MSSIEFKDLAKFVFGGVSLSMMWIKTPFGEHWEVYDGTDNPPVRFENEAEARKYFEKRIIEALKGLGYDLRKNRWRLPFFGRGR